MDTHILIIEDEARMARFLELELGHEGYAVSKASDGRTGLDMALAGDYDLILLDVMLPGLSGLEVLRRLRNEKSVPVLMLTARDAVMDKVSGLDMGANDYITKPFSIEELLARIRAALRSGAPAVRRAVPLRCGKLTLDPARHTAAYGDTPLQLTYKEFLLLQTLLENRDIVQTRDMLLEKVWGYDYAGETNVVDVYIRYLRQKLDDAFAVKLIHTVRGVGYVIKGDGI